MTEPISDNGNSNQMTTDVREETAPVTPTSEQVQVAPPDPTGADLPWSVNPAFTRKEAFDSLKKGHAPMTPAVAQQAAAMLLQGVPQSQIAKALGYSPGYGGKLVNSSQVKNLARRALVKAGVDEDRLAKKLADLLDAKKTEFSKYKGTLGESIETADNGAQLTATQMAYDILGGFGHKRQHDHAESGPKMVIQVKAEYRNMFFGAPMPMDENGDPLDDPIDVTPEPAGDPA